MAPDTRILNITRKFRLKRNQALRAIENCACAWVEEGVSIRDLTLGESIQARNLQAREREPLPMSEIPGLTFQPPMSEISHSREYFDLTQQANQFCAGY